MSASDLDFNPMTITTLKRLGIASLIINLTLSMTTLAVSNSGPEAVTAITKMLKSLDHIHTFQASTTIVKTVREKTSTLNFDLYSDNTGQAAAKITTPFSMAYVKNKKGLFVIQNGDSKKDPGRTEFPFDIPSQFFAKMNVKDVTDNYKFVVTDNSPDAMTIELIPIGTAGKSIAEAVEKNPVTMLRFTLNIPQYSLAKLEIFKNNATKTNDTIEITYDMIDTRKIIEKRFFRNKFASTEELAPTLIRTTTEIKKPGNSTPLIETKTTRYQHIKINEKIDPDRFNEEDY